MSATPSTVSLPHSPHFYLLQTQGRCIETAQGSVVFIDFRKIHCPVGTQGRVGSMIVIIVSKHGLLLANIPSQPAGLKCSKQQTAALADHNVADLMTEMCDSYIDLWHTGVWSDPSLHYYIVYPRFNGEVVLPNHLEIAKAWIKCLGLNTSIFSYNTLGHVGLVSQGAVLVQPLLGRMDHSKEPVFISTAGGFLTKMES